MILFEEGRKDELVSSELKGREGENGDDDEQDWIPSLDPPG